MNEDENMYIDKILIVMWNIEYIDGSFFNCKMLTTFTCKETTMLS
jgi:hypothetical protein